MKISIVTISFNQARFLEQAICSVINQDYSDIEYIVVDPGSTDGSREIIEKYRDRIDKIILDPDEGPADGLNKGFSKATGSIFGFLNSDDMLLPGALRKVAAVFLKKTNFDVVSGHGCVNDDTGTFLRRIYSDRFNLTFSAYGACILVQPSTFFRAEAFCRAGGFNKNNRSNWDDELFVDMAISKARFITVNEMLSIYRVHHESITGSAKLLSSHLDHQKRMFEKIIGRKPNAFDKKVAFVFIYARKICNPRDTYERILRGPVFAIAT